MQPGIEKFSTEKRLLASYGVEDLPWRCPGPYRFGGFRTVHFKFPGARVNGVLSKDGRKIVLGIHRDLTPDHSAFFNVGEPNSKHGHEVMTEARAKLGLPIRSRTERSAR